jgi:hypothetical protein
MSNELQEKLDEAIPQECIADKGGLDYVSHRYVKQRLNEVFGVQGWSYRVIETKLLSLDEVSVRWFTHLRLEVQTGVQLDKENWIQHMHSERDGIAVGHGLLSKDEWVDRKKTGRTIAVSPGRANEVIDFAAAESVTDALKRAAVSLGLSLGLQLYPIIPGKKKGAPATRPAPKVKTQAKKDIKF